VNGFVNTSAPFLAVIQLSATDGIGGTGGRARHPGEKIVTVDQCAG